MTTTMIRNLEDLMNHVGADEPFRLNGAVYKSTECGAFIRVRTPDGKWHEAGDDWSTVEEVDAFQIGTTVEGVDTEFMTEVFVLPVEADAVDDAVEQIEAEVEALLEEEMEDDEDDDEENGESYTMERRKALYVTLPASDIKPGHRVKLKFNHGYELCEVLRVQPYRPVEGWLTVVVVHPVFPEKENENCMPADYNLDVFLCYAD